MRVLVHALCRSRDAHRLARGLGLAGPLRAILAAPVAAIVEDIGPATLGSGLGGMDAAVALRSFQSSVLRLHHAGAICPARFGQWFEDDPAAERALRARADFIESTIARTEGCDEWTLRIRPVEPTAPGRSHPPTETPADLTPLPPASPGLAYLRARKQAFDEADGVPPALIALCRTVLKPAIDLARLTRLEGASPRVPFWSVACLVPRDEGKWFEEEIARVLRGGLARAVLTGPWPTYSFVDSDPATHAA